MARSLYGFKAQTLSVFKGNPICICFIILSLIISLSLITTVQRDDHISELSYGYSNAIQLEEYVDFKNQCKFYSKFMPTPSTLLSNETVINETIANSSVLPSICLKPAHNVLFWSTRPKKCSEDVFLIWLIKSSIYRNTLRRSIRNFWAQNMNYKIDGRTYSTRRLFLIGSDPQNSSMPTIQLESKIYNDILQGTFEDTFKSVTQKVVLGMKFVHECCTSAHFAVVVDDDATVAPWNLFQHLPNVRNLSDGQYFGGFFLYGNSPVRDVNDRWYVPEADYRCKNYPPYPLGTGFFMSKCTLDQLYEAAHHLYLFGMDDVFFGGLVLELGIKITEIDFANHYAECVSLIQAHQLISLKDMVICHGNDYPLDQHLLWSEFCHAPVSNSNFAQYNVEYCKGII